jgi:hypothetical protein
MKIGIMTIHRNHNYGSALQEMALQRVIGQLVPNVDVEMIDYFEPQEVFFSHEVSHILYPPHDAAPGHFAEAREQYKNEIDERFQMFESFYNEKMKCSPKSYISYDDLHHDCPIYDIYMTGADQTWNTVQWWYDKAQYPYFLGFTRSPNKIAYGCGMYWRKAYKPYRMEFETLALLRQYKRIMVREEIGANVLRKYLNQPIDVVLDPSLLLDRSDYTPLYVKPKTEIKKPYIFAFYPISNNVQIEPLTTIAKRIKTRIITITTGLPINNEYITTIVNAGPSQWLWLIAHADAVITSSFHAVAFSLIFNIPFVAVNKDERKRTILKTVGVDGHIFDTTAQFAQENIDISVDFTGVNSLLEARRTKCRSLLKSAIESCGNGV